MALRCNICERTRATGNLRSHSNIATKRSLLLNLQMKRIDGERVLICTSCLKTVKKREKAVA